ncbi:MAG: hypothetical protein D6828_00975, partial [Nitrospirae bacterium]
MKTIQSIKADFNLTPEDEKRLKELSNIMKDYADAFVKHLHRTLNNLHDPLIDRHLSSTELYEHHRRWFIDLFSGSYDEVYYQKLVAIGKKHVQFGINPHYINVAMNIIRDYVMDLFLDIFRNRRERVEFRKSFHKILSINTD